MSDAHVSRGRGGFSRRRFLQGAAGGLAGAAGLPLLTGADDAQAAVQCPNANRIVDENRCTTPSSWSESFRLSNYADAVTGFAARTSYNRGQAVELKLNTYDPAITSCRLEVYRLGYYGGKGGRLVQTINNVAVRNQGGLPDFDSLGYRSARSAWGVTATLSTSSLVSGVYLVKIVANTGGQNHVPFILRDDSRNRDLLVAMPTNTWQAYNSWAGKSLYNYNSFDSQITVTGSTRAAKVSFDRPLSNVLSDYNWVLRTEFPLIFWLERMGYDLAYTDDVGLHSQAGQLRAPRTKTLVIAGHSEYWTRNAFDNVRNARNAGTNIASFSANTAYWQVRLEEDNRALVCFKTVQGNNISSHTGDSGDQRLGCNDFGPGATGASRGGPNDPLGPNGTAPDSDDQSQYASTTFRDRGAPPGATAPNDPSLRGVGRVGPSRSENNVFGVLYIGDDDSVSHPLKVPAGSGSGGEFGAHPAWRNTSVANGAGASIGSNLIGWEWDGVPSGTGSQANAPYVSRQPSGVKRLTETNLLASPPPGHEIEYLQDAGHRYAATPPAGQSPNVHAVTYRAGSGALVFSAGTIQWSWGLGPHFLETFMGNYQQPPVSSVDSRIQQATYNILADGGVRPASPEGVVLDTATLSSSRAATAARAPSSARTGRAPSPARAASPPSRDVEPVRLTMPRRARRLRRTGSVLVSLRSTGEEASAQGVLTLFALLRRPGRRRRKRVKLGTAFVQVAPGGRSTVQVELPRRHRRELKRRGALRVEAVLRGRDQADRRWRQRSTFRLKPARRRRATR